MVRRPTVKKSRLEYRLQAGRAPPIRYRLPSSSGSEDSDPPKRGTGTPNAKDRVWEPTPNGYSQSKRQRPRSPAAQGSTPNFWGGVLRRSFSDEGISSRWSRRVCEKPVRRGMGFQPMQHRQDADATKAHGQDARATSHTPSQDLRKAVRAVWAGKRYESGGLRAIRRAVEGGPGGRSGSARRWRGHRGQGQRDLPERLAWLAGARSRYHAPAARARARAGGYRRGDGQKCHPLEAGGSHHGAVRLCVRDLPTVRQWQPSGL